MVLFAANGIFKNFEKCFIEFCTPKMSCQFYIVLVKLLIEKLLKLLIIVSEL